MLVGLLFIPLEQEFWQTKFKGMGSRSTSSLLLICNGIQQDNRSPKFAHFSKPSYLTPALKHLKI